jgi:DNA invertase Pin-like site-specific DNA recombinase
MRAAIYVRVSTSAQAGEDRVSLPEQARELKAVCEARNWQLLEPPPFHGSEALPAGVFGDPGVSGELLAGRPGIMALLEVVRAREVGAVLVRDTNRLSRRSLVMQQILADFEDARIRLITLGRDYDCSNDDDLMILGVWGSFDQRAKRWLVDNMRRAREAKSQRGAWSQAVRPYGYRWDKQAKRPVLVPEEGEVVQEVYHLADEERLPARAIARELHRRGVPTRQQVKDPRKALDPRRGWFEYQISAILKHRCYKGDWQTAPGVPAKDPPEALVDPARWDRVQALRVQHRKRTRRPPSEFLLSGMVFCGECGGAMTARFPQEGVRYYACNRGVNHSLCPAKHMPAEPLERAAWELVEELARNPRAAAGYAERTESRELPKWQQELARTTKALDDLDFEEDTARIAHRKGVNTLEAYQKDLDEIRRGRAELKTRRAQLEALIGDAEARAAAVNRVEQVAAHLAGKLDSLDFQTQRKVVQQLAFRVVVNADDWSKRRGREYRVRIECAGEAFIRAEPPLAELQAQS